jgi:hypothetical protein
MGRSARGLGGSLWLAIELNADGCRWCDRDAAGADTLNGLDRAIRARLLWPPSTRHAAATSSDVMAGSMVALPYMMLWPRTQHAEAIQTMAWVFAADAVGTGIPKRLFARERPYVDFNDTFAEPDSHGNASFPSNHTSRSFASVFAAAPVRDDRVPARGSHLVDRRAARLGHRPAADWRRQALRHRRPHGRYCRRRHRLVCARAHRHCQNRPFVPPFDTTFARTLHGRRDFVGMAVNNGPAPYF